MSLGSRNISPTKKKPDENVTATWSKSSAGSGTLTGYELRYTSNGGSSYTTVSSNIGADTTSQTFLPSTIDEQTMVASIRAKNSYEEYSDWGIFPNVVVYTDGMSVGKVNSNMRHLRAYVKVNGTMYKVKWIKVKIGGIVYNIDQYPPPNS